MRKIILFIIFVHIITACGDQKAEKILDKAWTFIDSQPDSSMFILKELGGVRLSEELRMKYLLLRTIAMDKLDINLDTIQYMDDVATYYAENSDRILKTRAYYMAGSVYRDRGNGSKALEYYKKAVASADTTQVDCDFKTLSRVYGQIATLFSDRLAPKLSQEAELKAVEYAKRAKDTIAAIIFYEHLGSSYRMMGRYDSVLYIVNN